MDKSLVRATLSVSAVLAGLSTVACALTFARLAVGAWQGWECATFDLLYSVAVAGVAGLLGCACGFAGGALGGNVWAIRPGSVVVAAGAKGAPGAPCTVCTDAADAVLRPCGHGGFCLGCTVDWAARCPEELTCPLCRAPVALVEYTR